MLPALVPSQVTAAGILETGTTFVSLPMRVNDELDR